MTLLIFVKYTSWKVSKQCPKGSPFFAEWKDLKKASLFVRKLIVCLGHSTKPRKDLKENIN